jgi:hypothetical protein
VPEHDPDPAEPSALADSMYGRVDWAITAPRTMRMSVGENSTINTQTVTQ